MAMKQRRMERLRRWAKKRSLKIVLVMLLGFETVGEFVTGTAAVASTTSNCTRDGVIKNFVN